MARRDRVRSLRARLSLPLSSRFSSSAAGGRPVYLSSRRTFTLSRQHADAQRNPITRWTAARSSPANDFSRWISTARERSDRVPRCICICVRETSNDVTLLRMVSLLNTEMRVRYQIVRIESVSPRRTAISRESYHFMILRYFRTFRRYEANYFKCFILEKTEENVLGLRSRLEKSESIC